MIEGNAKCQEMAKGQMHIALIFYQMHLIPSLCLVNMAQTYNGTNGLCTASRIKLCRYVIHTISGFTPFYLKEDKGTLCLTHLAYNEKSQPSNNLLLALLKYEYTNLKFS